MKIQFTNSIDTLLNTLNSYHDDYDQIFVITQKKIADLYLENKITNKHKIYFCDEGEKCKSLEEYQKLVKYLNIHHCNRGSLLIALGGGTITDLCGFVASTYMRGIKCVNVPTTLLGMVDAAIGGKTAINIGTRRNVIGTFYNPIRIIIFNKFLESLSTNELIDGCAEIIKYALIMDCKLFQQLEKNISKLLNDLDIDFTTKIIKKCINHKLTIVQQDQYDQGIRNILNFGHTIGHALESFYNFELSHGKAVLHGIKVASYLSYQKKNISESDYQKISSIIEQLKIEPLKNLNIDKILEYINSDKKHIGNQLNYILLKKIGSAYIEKNYNKKNLMLGLKIL